jgi:hypothetical protein
MVLSVGIDSFLLSGIIKFSSIASNVAIASGDISTVPIIIFNAVFSVISPARLRAPNPNPTDWYVYVTLLAEKEGFGPSRPVTDLLP